MERPLLLMLECDADDRHITESTFIENKISADIVFRNNSTGFFEYLNGCKETRYPSLILLDMNSTPIHAREVLKQLKQSPELCHIPVVILSELTHEKIIRDCYALGASSFIMKPLGVDATEKKIVNFLKYWLETVELV
ncbi:MAG: hypothetical protein ACJ77K_10690 [Bacteroidia bacterium]